MNIQIQSEGLPPERHADRIIAQMMRQLAREHAYHWPRLVDIVSQCKGGSPKAQQKLKQRLERAGALAPHLESGKRGKYELWFYSIFGWNAQKDRPLLPEDAVPELPQIVCGLTILISEGGGREVVDMRSYPVVFITHHVLSRAAQRLGLRTSEHMLNAVRHMLNASIDLLIVAKDRKKWIADAPAEGYRVKLPGGATVILRPDANRLALVARTIF